MAQQNRSLDIGTGLFALLGFAALAFLTTQLPGSGLHIQHPAESYEVIAEFDNIGGLKVGAPVSMAGVQVGRVAGIKLNSTDYKAAVTLSIERQYSHIPDDSDAEIQTSGLLGANYIGITAGGSDTFLRRGSQIQFTQSAMVLENLINKFFANTAGGKKGDSK
ncbi:MAG TPA: outer membrane lipid asymmetry maintenance protein MlaD [Steroidobacteraceae bacterium]|jgi:phospholipid/cholesterol/gamma-HCH transport system substrate-binding protein